MFKVFLDDIELQVEPEGTDNFSALITRDFGERDIITTFPSSLIFIGDGYQYIRSVLKRTGYCSIIKFRAEILCGQGIFREIFGTLLVADVTFNLQKCEAEAEITDDNFGARVENNKSIEVDLQANNTKSGDFLAQAPQFFLNLFKPSTGAFDDGIGGAGFANSGLRVAYDLKVAWAFQLAYISDNVIKGVKSDWYDALPDGERWAVVQGREMREGSGLDFRPNIAFEDLFEEPARLYNLMLTIEKDSNGDYFVRIEQESFFKNTNALFVVDKLKKISESFLQTLLFATIRFGDQNAKKTVVPTTEEIGYIRFFTHLEEQYHTDNQCNIDTVQELTTNELIIDHNIIVDVLFNNEDSFDDKHFLIQYNFNTAKASNEDVFGDGQRVYNPQALNNKVAERHDLQGAVAKFLGSSGDSFEASKTLDFTFVVSHPPFSATAVLTISEYNTVISNPNGNYSTATDRYTVPVSGIYAFHVEQSWKADLEGTPSGGFTRLRIKLERFNAANVLLETFSKQSQKIFGNITSPAAFLEFDQTSYMAATDYMRVKLEIEWVVQAGGGASTFTLLKDAIFSSINTFTGGGIYEAKESDDYSVSQFAFEAYLTGEQINLMLDNPHRPVLFNMDGQNNIRGWPLLNTIVFKKGFTTFNVLNSPNEANS